MAALKWSRSVLDNGGVAVVSSSSGLYVGPPSAPDRYRPRRSIERGGEAVLSLAELKLPEATEPVVVAPPHCRGEAGSGLVGTSIDPMR